MKTRQIMALSLSLVLVGGMFASCGSEENSAGVDVVVAASYVPEETTDTLQQALDGVYTEESGFGCTVTGVSSIWLPGAPRRDTSCSYRMRSCAACLSIKQISSPRWATI